MTLYGKKIKAIIILNKRPKKKKKKRKEKKRYKSRTPEI